jgi:hypothetical protein
MPRRRISLALLGVDLRDALLGFDGAIGVSASTNQFPIAHWRPRLTRRRHGGRPISEHANDVTSEANRRVCCSRVAYAAARMSSDRAALESASRDVRYWSSRRRPPGSFRGADVADPGRRWICITIGASNVRQACRGTSSAREPARSRSEVFRNRAEAGEDLSALGHWGEPRCELSHRRL